MSRICTSAASVLARRGEGGSESERERETFSGEVPQLQPFRRSEPRPFYPPPALLHKNISDVREVNRLRVRARRAGREK